jgi:DNA mismatch repair protein MutL
MLSKGDWSGVLREVLDAAEHKTEWSERLMISAACHGAVRAGQTLSDNEIREMVRLLEKTSSPHTCPHGRPTLIHLSTGQLSKGFGR